jgi:hypothetical protein
MELLESPVVSNVMDLEFTTAKSVATVLMRRGRTYGFGDEKAATMKKADKIYFQVEMPEGEPIEQEEEIEDSVGEWEKASGYAGADKEIGAHLVEAEFNPITVYSKDNVAVIIDVDKHPLAGSRFIIGIEDGDKPKNYLDIDTKGHDLKTIEEIVEVHVLPKL